MLSDIPEIHQRNSSANKLMQNKGQINVKRGLNSAAKPWTQFNYNTTFSIYDKIIAVNIH